MRAWSRRTFAGPGTRRAARLSSAKHERCQTLNFRGQSTEEETEARRGRREDKPAPALASDLVLLRQTAARRARRVYVPVRAEESRKKYSRSLRVIRRREGREAPSEKGARPSRRASRLHPVLQSRQPQEGQPGLYDEPKANFAFFWLSRLLHPQ
jgi:hypothetical protein